jgi:hypothetical protein
VGRSSALAQRDCTAAVPISAGRQGRKVGNFSRCWQTQMCRHREERCPFDKRSGEAIQIDNSGGALNPLILVRSVGLRRAFPGLRVRRLSASLSTVNLPTNQGL